MSPAAADEAALYFTVALTVLLAGSVLAVIRQPPWTPGPAAEHPGYPDGVTWANDEAAWANDEAAWANDEAAWANDEAARANDEAARAADEARPASGADRPQRAAGTPGRPGRHAAGTPAAEAPAPLPVRSPGQSGRTAPVAGDTAARPEGWRPPVSGGPPWGPAPRPPGAR